MTNKYEDALNEITEFSKEQDDGSVYVCVSGENYETIRSSLLLAQETEQLKAQREVFKAKMDAFLEEDITRTKTVDGATVGFIYRDELVEQLRLKLSETAIHLAARNSEIEQLRKERDELARAIIKIHEDQEGDYDFLKFISHPQYILAKKVAGE